MRDAAERSGKLFGFVHGEFATVSQAAILEDREELVGVVCVQVLCELVHVCVPLRELPSIIADGLLYVNYVILALPRHQVRDEIAFIPASSRRRTVHRMRYRMQHSILRPVLLPAVFPLAMLES